MLCEVLVSDISEFLWVFLKIMTFVFFKKRTQNDQKTPYLFSWYQFELLFSPFKKVFCRPSQCFVIQFLMHGSSVTMSASVTKSVAMSVSEPNLAEERFNLWFDPLGGEARLISIRPCSDLETVARYSYIVWYMSVVTLKDWLLIWGISDHINSRWIRFHCPLFFCVLRYIMSLALASPNKCFQPCKRTQFLLEHLGGAFLKRNVMQMKFIPWLLTSWVVF